MREKLATGRIAVAANGIDRFAVLRGAIGFALSGALVRAIGGRITNVFPDWAAGRLSTSDLMVAFPADNAADATARIEHLLSVLAGPYTLSGNKVDVGFTTGIVLMDQQGETTINHMDQATVAVDQARLSFRKIALFDPVAYGDPSSNLSLISDMMAGMEGGEMSLYFQPKMDLRAGRVTAAEALIRWRHPERGMVRPDLFVAMAEETGHIRPLTDWVLDRALADHQEMKAEGCPVRLSVNISGRVLGDPEFAKLAHRLARESAADLVFEITETAVIDNPRVAMKAIEDWKAAGIGISIDDYGSGLSSLAYLKQIKADELKIDRSLVASLARDQRNALMVKSTIDLAHGLGMHVTAEGIEDNDVLSALSVMGCDFAQGYYIAKPMPLAGFREFMANWHAPSLPRAGQGTP
jgi:EAL domain-containing protein (putative c-di-GMP-specific phosphodiesterase class I)/GGDEF domain-containing protein